MFSILLLITLFLQPPQSVPNQFEWISTESGLSNNIIYGTYQDSEGFIWIGTDNGLNRYDGYDFKVFYHNANDSSSISSNIVRGILEDSEGNLWVGTINGLNLYDRETEAFSHFFEIPNLPTHRLDIQAMELDSKDRLWFHTLRTGGWFDIHTKEFHFIDPEFDVFSIAVSKKDQVWFISKEGELVEYLPERDEFKSVPVNIMNSQTPIHWGVHSNSLWIKSGLGEESPVPFSILPKIMEDVPLMELLEVDANQLWVGTNQGLFIYSKESGNIRKIGFGSRISSLTESIRHLYKDKNGGVWVGTLNGLFYFDPYQKPFNHLDVIDGTDDVVMGMEEVSNTLWFNTFSNDMYTYSLRNEEIEKVRLSRNHSTDFYQVWDFQHVPNTPFPVWMASTEGLFLYDINRKTLKKISLSKDEIALPITFSIHEADTSHYWVSSQNRIHKLSKVNGEVKEVISFKKEINQASIQEVYQVEDKVFIATEGEGIIAHELGEEDNLPLIFENSSENEFSNLPVWDLILGSDNMLWMGTNRGLYKLDTETMVISHINFENEFANRIIFSILIDDNGLLWMGTEKGLVRFDPVNSEVTYYHENDGVINVEFNRRSAVKTSDGRLWFGGVKGITFFDPAEITPNPIIPPVHITKFEVITLDSTFIPGGLSKKEVTLPWHSSTIELEFSALNYSNTERNQYRYKLEGQDPVWVENKQTRSARYVQLPPGEYSFRVQGSNNDGIWNTEGASLQLIITPPFWKTIWFRALVILAVALILWSLYTYRVRKLLEVERIRLRIAGDLHDEVGSGLSGIALTGDLLQRQMNNGGIKPELIHRVTQNARNLASSLDAIVWLIDPKKETLEDFLVKCRTVANELLHHAKVDIVEEIAAPQQRKVLSSVHRRNLFLLFKEAIHNIAKHAEAKEVGISFKIQDELFVMYVNDDGKGFKQNGISPGHGLDSMQNRAKELDAHFSVHSDVGLGTHIELKVKLP